MASSSLSNWDGSQSNPQSATQQQHTGIGAPADLYRHDQSLRAGSEFGAGAGAGAGHGGRSGGYEGGRGGGAPAGGQAGGRGELAASSTKATAAQRKVPATPKPNPSSTGRSKILQAMPEGMFIPTKKHKKKPMRANGPLPVSRDQASYRQQPSGESSSSRSNIASLAGSVTSKAGAPGPSPSSQDVLSPHQRILPSNSSTMPAPTSNYTHARPNLKHDPKKNMDPQSVRSPGTGPALVPFEIEDDEEIPGMTFLRPVAPVPGVGSMRLAGYADENHVRHGSGNPIKQEDSDHPAGFVFSPHPSASRHGSPSKTQLQLQADGSPSRQPMDGNPSRQLANVHPAQLNAHPAQLNAHPSPTASQQLVWEQVAAVRTLGAMMGGAGSSSVQGQGIGGGAQGQVVGFSSQQAAGAGSPTSSVQRLLPPASSSSQPSPPSPYIHYHPIHPQPSSSPTWNTHNPTQTPAVSEVAQWQFRVVPQPGWEIQVGLGGGGAVQGVLDVSQGAPGVSQGGLGAFPGLGLAGISQGAPGVPQEVLGVSQRLPAASQGPPALSKGPPAASAPQAIAPSPALSQTKTRIGSEAQVATLLGRGAAVQSGQTKPAGVKTAPSQRLIAPKITPPAESGVSQPQAPAPNEAVQGHQAMAANPAPSSSTPLSTAIAPSVSNRPAYVPPPLSTMPPSASVGGMSSSSFSSPSLFVNSIPPPPSKLNMPPSAAPLRFNIPLSPTPTRATPFSFGAPTGLLASPAWTPGKAIMNGRKQNVVNKELRPTGSLAEVPRGGTTHRPLLPLDALPPKQPAVVPSSRASTSKEGAKEERKVREKQPGTLDMVAYGTDPEADGEGGEGDDRSDILMVHDMLALNSGTPTPVNDSGAPSQSVSAVVQPVSVSHPSSKHAANSPPPEREKSPLFTPPPDDEGHPLDRLSTPSPPPQNYSLDSPFLSLFTPPPEPMSHTLQNFSPLTSRYITLPDTIQACRKRVFMSHVSVPPFPRGVRKKDYKPISPKKLEGPERHEKQLAWGPSTKQKRVHQSLGDALKASLDHNVRVDALPTVLGEKESSSKRSRWGSGDENVQAGPSALSRVHISSSASDFVSSTKGKQKRKSRPRNNDEDFPVKKPRLSKQNGKPCNSSVMHPRKPKRSLPELQEKSAKHNEGMVAKPWKYAYTRYNTRKEITRMVFGPLRPEPSQVVAMNTRFIRKEAVEVGGGKDWAVMIGVVRNKKRKKDQFEEGNGNEGWLRRLLESRMGPRHHGEQKGADSEEEEMYSCGGTVLRWDDEVESDEYDWEEELKAEYSEPEVAAPRLDLVEVMREKNRKKKRRKPPPENEEAAEGSTVRRRPAQDRPVSLLKRRICPSHPLETESLRDRIINDRGCSPSAVPETEPSESGGQRMDCDDEVIPSAKASGKRKAISLAPDDIAISRNPTASPMRHRFSNDSAKVIAAELPDSYLSNSSFSLLPPSNASSSMADSMAISSPPAASMDTNPTSFYLTDPRHGHILSNESGVQTYLQVSPTRPSGAMSNSTSIASQTVSIATAVSYAQPEFTDATSVIEGGMTAQPPHYTFHAITSVHDTLHAPNDQKLRDDTSSLIGMRKSANHDVFITGPDPSLFDPESEFPGDNNWVYLRCDLNGEHSNVGYGLDTINPALLGGESMFNDVPIGDDAAFYPALDFSSPLPSLSPRLSPFAPVGAFPSEEHANSSTDCELSSMDHTVSSAGREVSPIDREASSAVPGVSSAPSRSSPVRSVSVSSSTEPSYYEPSSKKTPKRSTSDSSYGPPDHSPSPRITHRKLSSRLAATRDIDDPGMSSEKSKHSLDPGGSMLKQAAPAKKKVSSKRKNLPRQEWPRSDTDESYCHQCRRKSWYHKMQCSSCNRKYCPTCIHTRYPNITFDHEMRNFDCPGCNGSCNCDICCRKRGEVYVSRRTFSSKPRLAPPTWDVDIRTKVWPTNLERAQLGRKTDIPPIVGPVTYWASVYDFDGEKVATAFIGADGSEKVVIAHPFKRAPRKRFFIGALQPSWRLGPRSVINLLDAESPVVKSKRCYVGNPAPLFLPAATHELDNSGVREFSTSSLSPLPEDYDASGDEGEKGKVLARSFTTESLEDHDVTRAITLGFNAIGVTVEAKPEC